MDIDGRQGVLRLTSWRFRMGFGAAILATALMLLLLGSAHVLSNGGSESDVVLAASIAIAVEVWLVLAILSGKGRRVALGFLAGVLVTAMLRPAIGSVWALPARLALEATRPAWSPIVAASARSTQQQDWVGLRRSEIPTVVHAERLVNLVHECASRYRAADSLGSFPRDARELAAASNCGGLLGNLLGSEASPPPSYDLRTDYGWRWSYAPTTRDASGRVIGYAVRVVEDPLIGRPAPQFAGDESGGIEETDPAKPPFAVASPVRALAQLRRCLQRVPAEHERQNAQYGWERPHAPLVEVQHVCPELKGHYSETYPDRGNGALALSARDTPGEFVDTVAAYTVELTAADVEGFVFELRATPRSTRNPFVHSGVRRFFVARDGSIHVGTGPGPATISDPLAAECAADPGLCSDRPPEVHRAPGS